MSLSSVPVTIQMLQCSFCHSIHVSVEHAKHHGCTADTLPPKTFSPGDIVVAKFMVGAGLEKIGEVHLRGKVLLVSPPRPYQLPDKLMLLNQSGHHVSFSSYICTHDWLVTVEPIDGLEHTSFRKDGRHEGHVFTQTFFMSDLHTPSNPAS